MTLYRILFFCLFLPFWCTAVQPYTPVVFDPLLEPWRWRQEKVLDGLGVMCMAETADGLFWFGNSGSIASYDGVVVNKILFDEPLLSKINHRKEIPRAKALLILPDGNLLILIGESLVLRERDEWRVIIQDVGPSVFYCRLLQAQDETLWLQVPEGLWRISGDLSTCSKVMSVSSGPGLQSMCIDPAGDVWVVEKPDDLHSRLIHILVENGCPQIDMQAFDVPFIHDDAHGASIVADENGLIWYGDTSRDSGLIAFDPRRSKWLTRENEKILHSCFSLFQTRDGSIWAGSLGRILHSSRTGKDVFYGYEQVKLPRVPLSFFEARNGRLWVIGRMGHVCSVDLRTENWVTYEDLTFLNESPDGKQWFRLRRNYTVVSYDPHHDEWFMYGPEDGVIDGPYAMIVSSNGMLWIAGSHEKRAAIAVFDGTRWARFCHPEFASWIEPNAVFEAADGTLWFGAGGLHLTDISSAGGALQYEVTEKGDVRLLKHHAPPDFPYYVTALEQAPDGTMWIGSSMVYCYDGTLPIRRVSGLGGANSIEMLLDRNQTLWLAKEDYGICRRDGDVWRVFTAEDGLADTTMASMVELKDGTLMVSSHKGISRFDGTSWMAKAYPQCFAMKNRRSGLKESSDGSIWFNYTYNEMWIFGQIGSEKRKCYTVRNRPEKIPPDTVIIDYLKSVAPPGNTHITWSGHDPWGSTSQEDLQYSWRLNGGSWSPFSYETSKTFLELDSGKYTLEVRARDRAFNVDPTPDYVEFGVISPIWKQPWFLTMVSVFIGLILWLTWLLIRTRERNLKERQAEHEAFLVKQQAEHREFLIKQQTERERHLLEQQRNLIERQREHEAFLVKQQEEREEHLKDVDRLKMGFFTNISHELRTPMTVISGRLETILCSETEDKHKRALSIVLRNAQRVLTLVNQLLDFRKIEEGKIKVEAAQGDLIPPLRDWMASLQVLAESSEIVCTLESMDECRGWFDFDKVQKIFTNLIANSIKYTAAGGEVRVRLNVEVDGCRAETVEDLSADRLEGQEPVQPCKNKTTGRRLIFVVEDNGMGIAPEHLAHIFDRFYRVSEASMAAGAGIGLNLTKELVDLLGGEIQVESPIHPDAKRPGTRFTVRLPLDGNAMSGDISEKHVCEDPSAVELTNRTDMSHRPNVSYSSDEEAPLILVVEDDEDILGFIVDGLESSCRVETAENGEIGLRMAKEQVPDLIVTDLMMPVMDGLALCRELKTSMETSHIPVIMLTAKTALESQIEGLKTGADDYVTKPFHMVLLKTRIANLLESRRVLREKFCREYSVLTPKIPENTPEKEFFDAVLTVIEENYADENFNSDILASLLHMGLRTLQRKFKAVTDRTPSAFISEYRLSQAAELLKGTAFSIADITYEVGYTEPNNFYRMFKKQFNVSPSQYRAEHNPS